MKNILSEIIDNLLFEDAPFIYKTVINTLTGATCSAMMRHVAAKRKEEDTAPSLDKRNEQDENARLTIDDDFRMDNGFAVPMEAYKVAQLCDGIRHSLYLQFQEIDDTLEDPTALVYTPARPITMRTNWNQPMSAQLYMEYRAKMAMEVRTSDVEAAAKRFPSRTETAIRQAFLDEGVRQRKRIEDMTAEVLSEIASLEDVYSVDDFDKLDIDVQYNIIDKLASKIDREFGRLLPRTTRSLEAASQCAVLEHLYNQCKDWLINNDPLKKAA